MVCVCDVSLWPKNKVIKGGGGDDIVIRSEIVYTHMGVCVCLCS